MFGTGDEFDYAQCLECSTVYIQDIPTNLGDFYAQDAYYSLDADPAAALGGALTSAVVRVLGRSTLTGSDLLARAARRLPREQLHQLLIQFSSIRLAGLAQGRDSKVLDVGSGNGQLLYALSLAGLTDLTGVDPYVDGDRALAPGVQVLARELGDIEGQYDLVMLHHCFEHVPDPEQTLGQIARLLSPDGRVLIRIPVAPSEAFDRYGPDWVQLDPPRHLTVFSREGFTTLATRCGFEVERAIDDSTAFQFWASEQAKDGVAMAAPESHAVTGARFSAAQLRRWRKDARRANSALRGDQSAFVLRPVSAS